MEIHDDGRVTMTVKEMDEHLRVRGETARDVAVAGTALIVIVASAIGLRVAPYVLLGVAVLRLSWKWYREQ